MKTLKKPLYIIERPKDHGFDRKLAVEYVQKLASARLVFGNYISTVKKTNFGHLRTSANEARQAVKTLRDKLHSELGSSNYFILKRRFGLGEFVSVELFGHDYSRKQAIDEIKYKIRNIRKRRKENHDALSRRTPNWILKQLASRELNQAKSPKDNAQYVGIEIECILPHNWDSMKLSPLAKFVNVGLDGSIQSEDGYVGKELRVLVKRTEVRTIIPKLMDILNEMGAKVNKSCGLHVHLDQRQNLDPGASFTKLVRSLNLLYTVVPKSRRKNQYCHRNRRLDFNVAVHGDRYKAINAAAYRRYKTLEVRLFGGTLSAEKIINWIETLHAITEGTLPTRCPRNFDTATNYWNLSAENVAWLKARQTQFAALNLEAPGAESDTESNEADAPDHDETDQFHCDECGFGDHETEHCEERLAEAV